MILFIEGDGYTIVVKKGLPGHIEFITDETKDTICYN